MNVGNCYSGVGEKQSEAEVGRAEMTLCRAPLRFLLLNIC